MRLEEELKVKKFQNEKHKLIVNLQFSTGWIQDQTEHVFSNFGLSVQQFNILRILRGQYPNPSTILLLKERMIDRQSDVSRLVDRLYQKGLLFRSVCANDRRKSDVVISPKGLELLDQMEPEMKSMTQAIRHLSEEEAGILNTLLDKMRG